MYSNFKLLKSKIQASAGPPLSLNPDCRDPCSQPHHHYLKPKTHTCVRQPASSSPYRLQTHHIKPHQQQSPSQPFSLRQFTTVIPLHLCTYPSLQVTAPIWQKNENPKP
ncbi:hypothetical protein C1H46_007456 [Malus baccata]|uniref:Uncharacterized protein n=1 Tax=Malus baccata TaxID=106549 RepID=A0A540N7A6_MALBA|nr:hypothetical protein C1H46_007456 [Malus baccata]